MAEVLRHGKPLSDGLVDEDSNCVEQETTDNKECVTTPLSPSQSNNNNNNNNNTIKQTAEDLTQKGDAPNQDQTLLERPYSTHSSTNEMHLKSPVSTTHSNHLANTIACPLCQEQFTEKSNIRTHLTTIHNVKSEGLQNLLALVDEPKSKMPPTTIRDMPYPAGHVKLAKVCEVNLDVLELESAKLAAEDAIDTIQNDKDADDQFRCQTCSKTFTNIDQLYSHQNELGHLELKQTPRGPGYLCWKKGCNQYFKTAQALQMHFREIHAKAIPMSSSDRSEYKFLCQICPLAFKSQHKLHFHAQMHIVKSAVTCNLCSKSFQSLSLLSKHVETAHDLEDSELEQYRAEICANATAFATFMTDPKLAKVFCLSDTPKENMPSCDNGKKSESGIKPSMENGGIDSEDNSPASTPLSLENGLDKGGISDSLEMGENDMNSKEQQFFEDYINSQAFAEGSYEDPNRKFKCHRCRVAFTKQIYLTAHNKTIMHKKGEKMSYPVEKFLDPNRPYKCDICKESFTQQNILMVHFNSVSHLHKMKQAGLEGHLPWPASATSPIPQSTPSSASTSSPSPVETSERPSSKKSREPSPEDESQRPYKCNICKVSYSQGSTLDIHIRSVAHQTRASKLHELAMTGEVDLSRPLIEEPLDKSLQAQQQKLLNDFLKNSMSPLSQQSLLFQGLPGMTSFPGFPGLPSMPGLPLLAGLPPLLPLSLPNQVFATSLPSSTSSHSSQHAGSSDKYSSSSSSFEAKMTSSSASGKSSIDKISQQLINSQSMMANGVAESAAAVSAAVAMATASAQSQGLSGSIHVCQKCSAVFASQESYNQHQVQCSASSASPTPSSANSNRARFIGRTKTAVHRNLLENFGFECVMQFNEFNQRAIKKELKEEELAKEKELEKLKENAKENGEVESAEKIENGKEESSEKPATDEVSDEKVTVKEEKNDTIDLPEMNKSKCAHCGKQFSSLWVLKAHEEEVHKEIVPLEIVEEVGDQFKTDFEKKLPKELPPQALEIPFSLPTTPQPHAEEKSVKQEMPPPPPPPPPQMQLDMLQMMNMFNMGMMPMPMPLLMGSQPSLMPMMMPPPGLDMKSPTLHIDSAMPSSSMSQSQKRQMEQQAAMANQKRARTRINDEQLKVLRGYFDINNSPAEEQIQAMSDQTGLPMKVIKHWFRNTLFKERQRNKDSPYNFNNPPSTTLDLEEYEKTGKLTIIEDSSPPMSKSPSPALKTESEIKKEVIERREEPPRKEMSLPLHNSGPKETLPLLTPTKAQVSDGKPKQTPDLKQQSESKISSVPLASPRNEPIPSMSGSNMSSSSVSPMLTSPSNSFMANFVSSLAGMSTPNTPSYPPTSTTPNSLSHYDYSPPGSGSTGRRANRTRFTDYQIKCLQEYFEQNAYPKDDELEHLSKMLGLSPRVIVVWFQNARQKARKIYENQPADNVKDASGNSPYARTACLNYQCKKCQAVFQRYYDLIRHQKRSCFTEAEKQESNFMSDDSDSMSNVTSLDNTAFSDSESECSNLGRSIKDMNTSGSSDSKKYQCDRCDQSFNHFDQYREHQSVHMSSMYMHMPGGGAFGMLQSMASSQQQGMVVEQSPNKRKYEEEEEDQDQPRDKRLRTTILPEQLDYLYQKYQIDCNPSRKQLEAISKDVGLKKRVVQVWFQNTRARERKGQYRAHQQLIHKRCPVCRALFRAKSALESHLATKHPDEMAKGDINIDAIPDAAIESPGPSSSSNLMPPSPDYNKLLAPPAMQGLLPYMPPASLGGLGFPPMADPIQMSMKQFYEDSFKKYINELSSTSHGGSSHKQPHISPELTSTPMKSETPAPSMDDDAPLDLSKPLKVSTHSEDKNKDGPTSQSSFSSGQSSSGVGGSGQGERSRQNSGHTVHSVLGSAVDQAYMMNRFKQDSAMHHPDAEEESSNMSSSPASPHHNSQSGGSTNKRYRTQMTSLQVRIMKQIFQDYKTPTMAECEMLGRVIGLQKRVVQVWFQNARAKEKKAKLNMKYPPSEMDFPKPPEECTLCNFKYSHKYTIQDHIFTKKHIDKVREFIQSQTDAEREMSSTAASMAGVSGLLRSQQANDMDHVRKMMEESQMHQLQSMGLAPLGLPPAAMSGMGLLPPEFLHGVKKEGASLKEGKDGESKFEGSSRKESNKSGSGLSDGPLGPFGGLMPGMDPGMLPYMYPGLPGLVPGMPPMGQPGFMPGAEHLLGYDPMTYGTPLPLLQIPQQAIKDVSSKLMDPKATIGQYTQDCRSISSLRSLVSNSDYNCAREATVDVGYICKKCQMVYPAKEACVAHQRLMCFPGGKLPEGVNVMLKLEQIQYDCKLCSEKMSTVQEFKSHCEGESHKTKLAVYAQQRNSGAVTPKSIHSPRQSAGVDSEKSTAENSRKEST